jgi:hypothetical protein
LSTTEYTYNYKINYAHRAPTALYLCVEQDPIRPPPEDVVDSLAPQTFGVQSSVRLDFAEDASHRDRFDVALGAVFRQFVQPIRVHLLGVAVVDELDVSDRRFARGDAENLAPVQFAVFVENCGVHFRLNLDLSLHRIQEHFAAVQSREDPAEQDARLVAPVVTEKVARVDDLQFEQLVPLPGANVEVPT